MVKVSVVRTVSGIKQGLYDAIELIGGLTLYTGHGNTILLEPNLNGVEGATNKELVMSLIQLLRDFGMRRILLAESTF